MPQYFDFSRLITKYITDFIVIAPEYGYYDDAGDWVKGEKTPIPMQGAIISFKDSKIFRSEGTLTAKDKQLFMLEPISEALHGSQVKYGDNIYSIVDCTENAEFTGVWAYTLKYVSAFKEARIGIDLTEEIEALEQRLDGVLEASEEVQPEPETMSDAERLEQRLDGVTVG